MSQDRIDTISRSLADSTSRRGVLRLLGVGVAGTAITAVGLTEAEAERKKTKKAKAKKARAEKKPGGGTLTGGDVASSTGPLVDGTFTPTRFTNQGGQLVAIGTFDGTVAGIAGTQEIALPVNLDLTNVLECEILNLVLGPLTLNLLGLEVFLDTVTLIITANPAGGLLGQLLCAIANLLNGGGALNQLVGLLNRLLGALGL